MSVNKLTKDAHMKFVFYPSYCLIQDPRTEQILAKGKVIGNLYVIDNFKANANSVCICTDSSNGYACNCSNDTVCNRSDSLEEILCISNHENSHSQMNNKIVVHHDASIKKS